MFKKTKPKTSKPLFYPGQFIHTPKGWFYIVDGTRRYHVISKRLLDSWAPQRVTECSEEDVRSLRVAAKLKFRNGSLLHDFPSGKIYLIVGGKRMHIVSPDVLERIGAVEKEIITVSKDELNLHEEGAELH